MPEILKKSSKTGDRFTAISDLQNNVEHVSFRLGIGNSVNSFQRKFIVPRCLKIGNKFPVNSVNFKGIQLSIQFKNSLEKSSSIRPVGTKLILGGSETRCEGSEHKWGSGGLARGNFS